MGLTKHSKLNWFCPRRSTVVKNFLEAVTELGQSKDIHLIFCSLAFGHVQ